MWTRNFSARSHWTRRPPVWCSLRQHSTSTRLCRTNHSKWCVALTKIHHNTITVRWSQRIPLPVRLERCTHCIRTCSWPILRRKLKLPRPSWKHRSRSKTVRIGSWEFSKGITSNCAPLWRGTGECFKNCRLGRKGRMNMTLHSRPKFRFKRNVVMLVTMIVRIIKGRHKRKWRDKTHKVPSSPASLTCTVTRSTPPESKDSYKPSP